MGGLPVEGFLSLSSNIWKSTLAAKDSLMVCAFCLDSEPHEHTVVGTIFVSQESCSVQLKLGIKNEENKIQINSIDESHLDIDFDYESCDDFGSHGEEDLEVIGLFTKDDHPEISKAQPLKKEQPDLYDEQILECDLSSVLYDTSDPPLTAENDISTDMENAGTDKQSRKQVHRLKEPVLQFHRIKPVKVEINQEIKCEICGKEFQNKKALSKHIRIHVADRKYECEMCEKVFKYSTALKTHKSAIHGVDIKSHVCEICGVHVPTQNHLRYHMRAKHSDSVLICQHCGKEFKIASSLNRHIKSHYGIKATRPSQCTVCGLTYSRPDTLRAHMRTHTEGIHAHTCDTCGEHFGSFKKLRAHAQQHRFIRIFQNATRVSES